MARYINDPLFVDPLYAQYQKSQGECKRFPLTALSPYPIVDPYRSRLGWGSRFRSQHNGICPPGYVLGKHNMCYPINEEIGTFYTIDFKGPPK